MASRTLLPGRVSAVKRRLALTAGALLAAVAFSSCSSVKTDAVVSNVSGHELTESQLNKLVADKADAAAIRDAITTWIEVVALSGKSDGLQQPADLAAGKEQALTDLIDEFSGPAQAAYDKGLNGSPILCLAAIPLPADADTQAVLAAATSNFADAAAKYSTDTTLQQSGGVIPLDQQGTQCGDSSTAYNSDLIGLLAAADAHVGVPALVTFNDLPLIMLLRPFDSLPATERLKMAANEVGAELGARYEKAKISVDPRFGRWDSKAGKVVGLGEG